MFSNVERSVRFIAVAVSVTVASLTSVAAAMRTSDERAGAETRSLSEPVCVAVGAPGRTETIVWQEAPAVPGAEFALVWNPDFQAFEILWANTTEQPLQFRFVADSGRAVTQRPALRKLGPLEKESLPGATVLPAGRTGEVCVRTDDTD